MCYICCYILVNFKLYNMKRKVIFRIREELNEELKQIQFIPEAKGYIDNEWTDISVR